MKLKDEMYSLDRGSSSKRIDSREKVATSYPIEDKMYLGTPRRLSVISSRRLRIAQDFNRLKTRDWPEEIKPSEETIDRAEKLWKAIQHSASKLEADFPRIGPADDNSVDMFWGNKKERILCNIPDDNNELIFLHFINEKGQTIVNFSDSHAFNVINLVRELRGSLD